MVQRAQNQHADESTLRRSTPATYGQLVEAAREAVDHACLVSTGRFASPMEMADELTGYSRFLVVAGRHLRLLASLGAIKADGVWRLGRALTARRTILEGRGAWWQAATVLGTAHDLIASHTDPLGRPLTDEARTLAVGPPAAHAVADLVEVIVKSTMASGPLIERARSTFRQERIRPLPKNGVSRLHDLNDTVALIGRATLWDLRELQECDGPSAAITTLQPALRRGSGPIQATITAPWTPMGSFRIVRHFVAAQADGRAPASPGSLRDLALLGARIFDPEAVSRADATPLARLQLAHTVDAVAQAREAWTRSGVTLTQTVQGLTKAPGEYGAAIHVLLASDHEPHTRKVLAQVSPELAEYAAQIIGVLAERNELVTRQRLPAQIRTTWRPITTEQADRLADLFRSAGRASDVAASLQRNLTVRSRQSSPPPLTVPAPSRDRERGRAR